MRNRIIALGIVLIAAESPQQHAEAGFYATEFTQALNHGQLVMEYIRQGEQLANAIEQLRDAIKNSQFSTSMTFGAISQNIASLDGIVMGGQALAYSLGNLDTLFAETFPGYQAGNRYFQAYKKWSQTSLDTTRGVLRAAGLQSKQMASEQAVINALRNQALSPVGRMQALQVLQQISEHQVEQLMKLRQLMIADMSSKQAYQAATIQQQAASEAATERFFTFTPVVPDGQTYKSGWR
jgi:P-type conjugative transfer protein TrbJ